MYLEGKGVVVVVTEVEVWCTAVAREFLQAGVYEGIGLYTVLLSWMQKREGVRRAWGSEGGPASGPDALCNAALCNATRAWM